MTDTNNGSTWEVASVIAEDDDTSFEHFGDYPSRESAIDDIRKQGAGDFAMSEADEGHYREFFTFDGRGNLLVSDTGEKGSYTTMS